MGGSAPGRNQRCFSGMSYCAFSSSVRTRVTRELAEFEEPLGIPIIDPAELVRATGDDMRAVAATSNGVDRSRCTGELRGLRPMLRHRVYFPDADGAVEARRKNGETLSAIRFEGEKSRLAHLALMAFQNLGRNLQFVGPIALEGRVKDGDSAVGTGDHDEFSVRAKPGIQDHIEVWVVRGKGTAGLPIPDTHLPIRPSGEKLPSIRAEAHGVNRRV